MSYRANRISEKVIAFIPLTAILAAVVIYVVARPSEPMAFQWIRSLGLGGLLDALPSSHGTTGAGLSSWLVYSLPNALWAFAYALIITRIWTGSHHWIKYLWLASIPLLVLGLEFLQLPGIIPGTFSPGDLAAAILGSSAGIFLAIKFKKT